MLGVHIFKDHFLKQYEPIIQEVLFCWISIFDQLNFHLRTSCPPDEALPASGTLRKCRANDGETNTAIL